jgi:hypothetical protein
MEDGGLDGKGCSRKIVHSGEASERGQGAELNGYAHGADRAKDEPAPGNTELRRGRVEG